MNYSESLLELIKSKKHLVRGNQITLSLGEIADAWNRKNIWREVPSMYPVTNIDYGVTKFLDFDFLSDIVSVLAKFQDQKFIEYIGNNQNDSRSLSDPLVLDSIHDKIFLEVKSNLNEYQKLLNIEEVGALRETKNKAPILIKYISLDEKNYLLEINNGEKIISFKSKKKGEGLDKETKQFKILFQLWEFRWELKNEKVLKKGDYASLDNLARGSGSEGTEAAYKHIRRLNNRFRSEGASIEIKGENEKYRLIINRA